jgi:cytochrome c oxidase assembly factor 4
MIKQPTDDEKDEYEERIRQTGCYDENEVNYMYHNIPLNVQALQLCFNRTKDWRSCKTEMETFRQCYQRYQQQRQHNKNDIKRQ